MRDPSGVFLRVGFAMRDDNDCFLQELPAIPKELREDFPGKLHLWFLWAIIRRYENSTTLRLPCRLAYKKIAILLQKEMGLKQPYLIGTITRYLTLLREKGWVQTFRLIYPSIRRIGVACPSRIKKSYPEVQFANYARNEGNGRTPIICCIFQKDGVVMRLELGATLACPSRIANPGPMLFTNVNNVLVESLSSFCGAKKREIRGILNMKGFHDYFEKTDKPTDEGMAYAKRLFAVLLECGVLKGKRVSLEKWAYQLSLSHKKYPTFPIVFDLLIASLPQKPWLRNSVQSPRALHKKFNQIEEWLSQKPKSSKYDLPPDFEDYEEAILDDCNYFNKTYPEVCELVHSVHPTQMKRAIYDSYILINRIGDALKTINYPIRTKMSTCVDSFFQYLNSEKTYRSQMGLNFERLEEWSKTGWKGHLVGRNNIGLVEVDEGTQLSVPASRYIGNLFKKTASSPNIQQRVIADLTEEIEK